VLDQERLRGAGQCCSELKQKKCLMFGTERSFNEPERPRMRRAAGLELVEARSCSD